MVQRLDEWKNLNARRLKYHLNQWAKPYQSTLQFANFIRDHAAASQSIIDLGCGSGSTTHYLASQFHHANFLGVDISEDHIQFASSMLKKNTLPNIQFELDDWFNLTSRKNVDGVISLQTLLGLPDWQEPLRQIFDKTDCQWIAFSSLFYTGDISCKIEVTEHKENASYFYNVYSIPQIKQFAKKHHFEISKFSKFEIDLDLAKPNDEDYMGTYTLKTPDHPDMQRIQISGPLLMNWGFLMLKRIL